MMWAIEMQIILPCILPLCTKVQYFHQAMLIDTYPLYFLPKLLVTYQTGSQTSLGSLHSRVHHQHDEINHNQAKNHQCQHPVLQFLGITMVEVNTQVVQYVLGL